MTETETETSDYSACYDPDHDFDRWYTKASVDRIAAWITPGDRVLELGCATGAMTAVLVDAGARVTALDRARTYLDRVEARGLTGVDLIEADIEQGLPDGQFDHVVAANVIHELDDPHRFLERCRNALAPDGHLHLTHQNPLSLHRLVALEMGLISDLSTVSERGRNYSTKRLYLADELACMGAMAGLEVLHREGVLFKPLPNSLMETLPEEVIEGFVRVAHHLPGNCAINYLVLAARPAEESP